MSTFYRSFLRLLLVCGAFFSFVSQSAADNAADGVKTFTDFKAFYSVTNTALLPPQVAKTYHIPRSPNRAIINLAFRTIDETLVGQSLGAKVKLTASNGIGQTQFIEMNEVKEGDAIYYIGVIKFDDEETFNFQVKFFPFSDYKEREFSFVRKLHHE